VGHQLARVDLEPAVVARARADAHHHVAAWRPSYEESLDVSLSWIIASRELGIGAPLRPRYLAALVEEARRLHTRLVVRASAAATDWVHGERLADVDIDKAGAPEAILVAGHWRVVAREIGVQVDNGLVHAAFEQLVRVAVAREVAHVVAGCRPPRLEEPEIGF
jgi:hypothetical protein